MSENTGKDGIDSILHTSLLYDFYSELLTEKQRSFLYRYREMDYSLAEIAEEEGITPQAVRDLIIRTEQKLSWYENRLGLVARHEKEASESASRGEIVKELVKKIKKIKSEIPKKDYAEIKDLVKMIK